MNYTARDVDAASLLAHLRNKYFDVQFRSRGGLYRALRGGTQRLVRLIAARGTVAEPSVVVSEQIVETPLVYRYLRESDRTVLDFGGYESLMPLQLSALGHQVTVLDQRRYPFTHENLSVYKRDLFDSVTDFKEAFDVVVSISTIEHLGLGSYRDQQDGQGDARGVDALWQMVRPGGRLLASVPAGRPALHGGYRVYDEGRVRALFPSIVVLRWFAKDGRFATWREVTGTEIASHEYESPNAALPVEAIAFVVCEKDL